MAEVYPCPVKKRVLISGYNGFTGRYVRDACVSRGWAVFGFGRRAEALPNYFQADLLLPETLDAMVREVQPHAVVHLAGVSFPAHDDPIEFYNMHVQGTLNLLSALVRSQCPLQKVLLASSANVYGNATAGRYDELAPLKPFNDYGVSKLAMEYMAWLWRNELPIAIARPFNYTGVGQAGHFLLPKIVAHYRSGAENIELGNLHVKRDYSDVRNVAEAYCRLLECSDSKGAINVCAGQSHSASEVLQMMADITGRRMTVSVNPDFVRPGEVEVLYGSHQKLESMVGTIPWIPLRDTLRWMLDSSF